MAAPERCGIVHDWGRHKHNAIADMKNFNPATQLFPPIISGPYNTLAEAQDDYNRYFANHPKTIIVFLGEGELYESPFGEAKIHGDVPAPWCPSANPDGKKHL